MALIPHFNACVNHSCQVYRADETHHGLVHPHNVFKALVSVGEVRKLLGLSLNVKYSNKCYVTTQEPPPPLVEIRMAEAIICGFSHAICHRQVPSEEDDRKGFHFMPWLLGRQKKGGGL